MSAIVGSCNDIFSPDLTKEQIKKNPLLYALVIFNRTSTWACNSLMSFFVCDEDPKQVSSSRIITGAARIEFADPARCAALYWRAGESETDR